MLESNTSKMLLLIGGIACLAALFHYITGTNLFELVNQVFSQKPVHF